LDPNPDISLFSWKPSSIIIIISVNFGDKREKKLFNICNHFFFKEYIKDLGNFFFEVEWIFGSYPQEKLEITR
jgi:hypothetical protein